MDKKKGQTPSRTTASGARDFVGIAKAYARKAAKQSNSKTYGKLVRQAAQRFLGDLKRAQAPDAPFYFDDWNATDPCDFIEKLPHVEGVWDTRNIVLHEAHVFFVVNLFGFRNHDTTRRFTTALFSVARKNAKSTLAAAILLYCECCEDEPGLQVITAATTGSQARIVFDIAKHMVEKTPELREAFTLAPYANAIARYEVGGTFKPINAKASTQDGLNPSHVGLDEIHAHKDHDLLNVIRSAAGARRNPLFLYTTTEGYENAGPWGELRHFAKQVLDGVLEADHFLVHIYTLDEDDEDFCESTWIKANPLMPANPLLLKEIRKMALEAKSMPGTHSEFRIKRLNRPSASGQAWLDLARWKLCGGPVDLDYLRDIPCWGGLDLASTRDLTSFRLVWKIDDRFYTWGRRWVPAYAVAQRTERGSVPYAAWIERGLIEQTEGDVTDYAVIEQAVLNATNSFNIQQIGFDKWNAVELCTRLNESGAPMVQFIQGPKSYHPAMQALERAYIEGNFNHGGDPVLTWCASNMVARTDANMNQAPDRKRVKEKIDDIVALLMAMGLAILAEETGSVEDFARNAVYIQ